MTLKFLRYTPLKQTHTEEIIEEFMVLTGRPLLIMLPSRVSMPSSKLTENLFPLAMIPAHWS